MYVKVGDRNFLLQIRVLNITKFNMVDLCLFKITVKTKTVGKSSDDDDERRSGDSDEDERKSSDDDDDQ